uniref:Uncharacterized protein n=1 Tax=Micrurus surinamensis TaxID=129470 RepID=A0A2D4P9I3_MICSU
MRLSVHHQHILLHRASFTAAENRTRRAVFLAEHARFGAVFAFSYVGMELSDRCFPLTLMLDGLIRPSDKSNEEAEHHIDEKADEAIQVQLTEKPHQVAALLHVGKRHKHIIPIDEGE